MECAGNGRALLEPRPLSQPWLEGAIGTARWRGTPLDVVLERAQVLGEAGELVFAGLDRGVEGGEQQRYERSLMPDQVGRGRARVRDERRAAAAPARLSPASRRAWLVRDDEREVARPRSPLSTSHFSATSRSTRTGSERRKGEEGRPVTRIQPRALLTPARRAGLLHPPARSASRGARAHGTRMVRVRAGRAGRGEHGWWGDVGGCGDRRRARIAVGLAGVAPALDPARSEANTFSAAVRTTAPAACSRSTRRGTSAATRTTPSSVSTLRSSKDTGAQRGPLACCAHGTTSRRLDADAAAGRRRRARRTRPRVRGDGRAARRGPLLPRPPAPGRARPRYRRSRRRRAPAARRTRSRPGRTRSSASPVSPRWSISSGSRTRASSRGCSPIARFSSASHSRFPSPSCAWPWRGRSSAPPPPLARRARRGVSALLLPVVAPASNAVPAEHSPRRRGRSPPRHL